MDSSLYFQKMILLGGALFIYNFFSEKAKHFRIFQCFGDNMGKTKFLHRPFPPTNIVHIVHIVYIQSLDIIQCAV